MYWDRFDIASAYYHFADLLAKVKIQGRYRIKIVTQLDRLRYRPGLSDSNLATTSENAREIYIALVKKHLKVRSTKTEKPEKIGA
jgi:hypothetical protein